MHLTKHENETYRAQTLYISGHAYLNCKFEACTLIVNNLPMSVQGCTFSNCNWHFDYDVLWGEAKTLENLRGLLDLIAQGMKPAPGAGSSSGDGGGKVH